MAELFSLNDIDVADLLVERSRALSLITEVVSAGCVFEVGSTAVEGLVGKQDLDFLVRVPAAKFSETRAVLDTQFKRNEQQFSSDVYQGYKIDSVHDVAIQLIVEGGPNDNFLVFLDALRNSVALRDKYNQLKQEFDGCAMADYREAKRAFVEGVLQQV